MADFKNYDPGKVFVSFQGIQVTGYAEGTFVSVERAEDAFEMAVGSGGDVTRVRNRNRCGSVTVTLMAESPTNDLLTAVAKSDELFGDGYGAVMVKDGNGTSIYAASTAWIRKMPTSEYADGASTREWTFDCAELDMNPGGALV